MPGPIPQRTTNGSRAGDAYNKASEALRSHQPIHAPGNLTSHTVHGTMHEAEVQSGGGYAADSEVSGVSYEGDYDPAKDYTKGMIVRKRSGSHQGLYICNEDAAAGTAPIFPEPTSGTVHWHIFALGIISTFEVTSDPAMNVKQVYIHASEPYI